MENQIRVDCIDCVEQFRALHSQWNTLVEQSIHPQPFLLWEWIFTWWEVYQKPDYRLLVLAVYDGDKLLAIAPFYIDNSHWMLRGRLRMNSGTHQ